jgi:hypothetical protein
MMKAKFVSNRVAKAFAALVATVILFIASPMTSRAGIFKNKKAATSISESQVSIHYIGSNENSVIFSVKFENPAAENFWLIIKNEAGDVIYHQQFNEAHFSREIHLEKDESKMQPVFIIRKGNEQSVHRFEVNVATTEQVVVTKG